MKILLVNLMECPENLHFEQAFIRALKPGASLDIVHDFHSDYSFLKKLTPPGGRRVKYSTLAGLKHDLHRSYDLLTVLDFPKRKACAAPFLSLLKNLPCAVKVFIANHLIPMPGHNPTADITRKLGLLGVFDLAYVFEFDDRSLWAGLGLADGRMLGRGYAVDCRYYHPAKSRRGNSIFSAGSTGRDFSALAMAVNNSGLTLKIFSDAPVPPFAADFQTSLSVSPLSRNLHNLRQAVLEARAVVIPISDSYINEAAGNSIAFIAMACGRPVITKKTPYMAGFIEDGVNGFFYESLTTPDLSRQLWRALSLDPARSRRLENAARAVILKKASLDAFAAGFFNKFILKK
jgi:glycosyltransferase involved in cell wall biosynthesis